MHRTQRVGWDFDDESPGNDARGEALLLSLAPEVETHLVNAVLTNGARYYVDHAHPEYSCPEAPDARTALVHDRAGEEILVRSMEAAGSLLPEGQEVVVYKNNSDGKGNSYGCHENFLVDRSVPFGRIVAHMTVHLVSRQVFTGAGKVGSEAPGTRTDSVPFQLTQRADFFEEEVGLETTLKRPIINTRDEPHADAERFLRLHVIVGDSNMSEATTLLKVGSADLVLRMLEAGVVMRDLTLENPIRAIREISHDPSGSRTVRLANGRELTSLQIQSEYFEKARDFADRQGYADDPGSVVSRTLELWERTLKAVETGDLSLVENDIDWVIKLRLIERYMAKHAMALADPRIAQLDLAYHDITRSRGLYYLLLRRGQVTRLTHEPEVLEAKSVPPQTTRARLRGEFIRRAQERRRDFTVDWVHLKLNDQAQRTVLCKDPFASVDERVDKLIASM
ncbi:MAG: proteasome accessory factor PafA2 family protein [Actinomycetota bacterium]